MLMQYPMQHNIQCKAQHNNQCNTQPSTKHNTQHNAQNNTTETIEPLSNIKTMPLKPLTYSYPFS